MLGKLKQFLNRDRTLELKDNSTGEKIRITYSTRQAKQEALDYLNSNRSYLDDIADENPADLV